MIIAILYRILRALALFGASTVIVCVVIMFEIIIHGRTA